MNPKVMARTFENLSGSLLLCLCLDIESKGVLKRGHLIYSLAQSVKKAAGGKRTKAIMKASQNGRNNERL